MTAVGAAPASRRGVSLVGVGITGALFAASALPALLTLGVVMGLEPSSDYPGLGLVMLVVPTGVTLYSVGAIAATATFWPERKGVGRAVLVAAAVPWVVALLASLPFVAQVCTRPGGACG